MISNRYKYDGKPEIKLNNTQLKAKSEIEEKVNSRRYKFEEVACPSCKSSFSEILAEKDRYGLKFTARICRDCGFVYTSPRMTQKSYAEFYDSEYRRLYVGTEEPCEAFFNDQRFRGERILKYIKSNYSIVNKDAEILEIGCGAGGILSVFKDAGYKITGLDLGEEYLNYGKEKYGLNLIKGSLSDLYNDYKADVIIYSHVFEHILDLHKELETIKKHLNPSGIVYIEVPGIKYIHSTYDMNFLKYLQNAHTYHFSLNSLNRIFTKHGFSLFSGDEQIRSIFKFSVDSQNKQFTNEYDEIINYLRKTEKRKFLHLFAFKKLRWKLKKALLKLRSK